jgi:hypothetical protein
MLLRLGDHLLAYLQTLNQLFPLVDDQAFITRVDSLNDPKAEQDLILGEMVQRGGKVDAAILWGCLTLGATLRADTSAANHCLYHFRHYLSCCFDEPSHDVITAHTLMALSGYLCDDAHRVRMSLRFARQLSSEIPMLSSGLVNTIALLLSLSSHVPQAEKDSYFKKGGEFPRVKNMALPPKPDCGMAEHSSLLQLRYLTEFTWAMKSFCELVGKQETCVSAMVRIATDAAAGRKKTIGTAYLQSQMAQLEEIECVLSSLLASLKTEWPSIGHLVMSRLLLGLILVQRGKFAEALATFALVPHMLKDCLPFLTIPFVWHLCHSASLLCYCLGATQTYDSLWECMMSGFPSCSHICVPPLSRRPASPTTTTTSTSSTTTGSGSGSGAGTSGVTVMPPLFSAPFCNHEGCVLAEKIMISFLFMYPQAPPVANSLPVSTSTTTG